MGVGSSGANGWTKKNFFVRWSPHSPLLKKVIYYPPHIPIIPPIQTGKNGRVERGMKKHQKTADSKKDRTSKKVPHITPLNPLIPPIRKREREDVVTEDVITVERTRRRRVLCWGAIPMPSITAPVGQHHRPSGGYDLPVAYRLRSSVPLWSAPFTSL